MFVYILVLVDCLTRLKTKILGADFSSRITLYTCKIGTAQFSWPVVLYHAKLRLFSFFLSTTTLIGDMHRGTLDFEVYEAGNYASKSCILGIFSRIESRAIYWCVA